jgi:predicted O-methyltransferase YrrM
MPATIAPEYVATTYANAFAAECARAYPPIDRFEESLGYALDRARLEDAARVLACPIKKSPPNWQHGRVLYALVRRYAALPVAHDEPLAVLDIGTAKGFSALCLRWAIDDSGRPGGVTSVDVIDPAARVRRNTVAEIDGYKTLAEILTPWPDATRIDFKGRSGAHELSSSRDRIHVAFIDGKHNSQTVQTEGYLLAARQSPGDLAIFDDVQLVDLARAVRKLARKYQIDFLFASGTRAYAIGVRS